MKESNITYVLSFTSTFTFTYLFLVCAVLIIFFMYFFRCWISAQNIGRISGQFGIPSINCYRKSFFVLQLIRKYPVLSFTLYIRVLLIFQLDLFTSQRTFLDRNQFQYFIQVNVTNIYSLVKIAISNGLNRAQSKKSAIEQGITVQKLQIATLRDIYILKCIYKNFIFF